MAVRDTRFTAAAWLFFAYLLAVILFGAWVRISHSGDGCGSNWPTCGGEILPSSPSAATLIEFTHRVTSGLCGVFGIGLLAWAWRLFARGPVTRAVALTLLFIVIEGAIGAGLVLGELVADNASVTRAVVVALHLTNTLALMAFAALAAWRSAQSGPVPFLPRRRLAFAAGIALVVLTAASGAVTALGDTLFPRGFSVDPGLLAEIRDDVSAGSHFLIRLRVWHPVIAVATAAYVIWLLVEEAGTNLWARTAMYLAAAQVAIGFFNLALSAPGWLQLVHLAGAQAFWAALVLTCASLAPLQGRSPA